MTHLDINIIVARHFGSTVEDIMHSQKYSGAIPRCAAMLICKVVLNAGTPKLKQWYGKHQHTTPLRALRMANNRLLTEDAFRKNYEASLLEVQSRYKIYLMEQQALLNARSEKKTIKQIYNLNHRVREKGISVRTRSRTLSCSEQQLKELNDSQLRKLLNDHKYAIQLSIL